MKFQGTKGPWRIDHWIGNNGGLKCIKLNDDGINRFSGSAVNEVFYQVTADIDPMAHSIQGDFRGAHISKVIDFKCQDGGVEALANVRLIAASPELLEVLQVIMSDDFYIQSIEATVDGAKSATQLRDKANNAINKALGINEVKKEI